jgi:hypothetical protein
MPSVRRAAVFALVALLAVSSVVGQATAPPPSLTPEGGGPLTLLGHATRVSLLGAVDVYRLALYADGPPISVDSLRADDKPKALRIEVLYQEDLLRRVPIDWRRELVPVLETPATTHLRAAFGSLRQRDVLLVEYVPSKGTAVRVNRTIAVGNTNHDLMLAFLDHWLGQRPVSEEIKRALLGPS